MVYLRHLAGRRSSLGGSGRREESMGEIDTDPIKSVRASLSHFGEKCSQVRSRSGSDDELEKVKDLEVVLQDLANCKVQLEAMDSAHKQALLNKDHHEKTVDGLSMLLKTSEFEKDIYVNECKQAKVHATELESNIQKLADELSDLKSSRAQLLTVEKQLAAATEAKIEAIKHAETLNESILSLQISSMEAEYAKVETEKCIELLQSELTQLKLELRGELETVKNELEEMSNKENEAQVEIALLKAELHKGRSKCAAAEAAELKAKGEKSAAYFALQQIATENQELKKENQRLQSENSNSDDVITISLEEYEILVKKAEEAKVEPEMENLKRDLESAIAKVTEFRTRAEQAATRAEVAEEAKAAVEEQIKRWKEQKQRRRAAMAALRAESMSKSSRSFEYDDNPKTYMPLGKFLKMNF
ncbi:hypothetical protein L2E82_46626 [Cichorium intybus]|uniref:Uncharacterized protein n=1 Tax=Cichorium intybus TaxID=13427 RepID=A0ACB8YV10_CICIN|nr:hypothetical protein L2E82_46626 [Cichorium intybus]